MLPLLILHVPSSTYSDPFISGPSFVARLGHDAHAALNPFTCEQLHYGWGQLLRYLSELGCPEN